MYTIATDVGRTYVDPYSGSVLGSTVRTRGGGGMYV